MILRGFLGRLPIAQIAVLAIFVVLTIAAAVRFRGGDPVRTR